MKLLRRMRERSTLLSTKFSDGVEMIRDKSTALFIFGAWMSLLQDYGAMREEWQGE